MGRCKVIEHEPKSIKAPPVTYSVSFTGLTQLQAAVLRGLLSDSSRYRKRAAAQNKTFMELHWMVARGSDPLLNFAISLNKEGAT